MFRTEGTRTLVALALAGIALLTVGCRQKMAQQPYYDPYEASDFFADGKSARLPVENTVARGHLNLDEHLHTARVGGELVDVYPFAVTAEVLDRGRERYNIYCTPCHGAAGLGNGVVVRRGYRPPPSFLDPKFNELPVGHYVDVMTNGFGAMPSYAAQTSAEDRWAIAAYIEALQMSQNVDISQLPAATQAELRSMSQ